MADRIKVLRYGETVEEASTRDMLESPKEAYTRSLWAVRSINRPAQSAEQNILEIENVDAAYGNGLKVLHDVSIKIPRGRTVAIVGESGSGKSTTARVITGLLPQTKGRVTFNDQELPKDLSDRSVEQLQKIQMIYQSADTAMNPRHTVFDIIGRPLQFYRNLTGNELTAEVIRLVELIELDESFLDRLPSVHCSRTGR